MMSHTLRARLRHPSSAFAIRTVRSDFYGLFLRTSPPSIGARAVQTHGVPRIQQPLPAIRQAAP